MKQTLKQHAMLRSIGLLCGILLLYGLITLLSGMQNGASSQDTAKYFFTIFCIVFILLAAVLFIAGDAVLLHSSEHMRYCLFHGFLLLLPFLLFLIVELPWNNRLLQFSPWRLPLNYLLYLLFALFFAFLWHNQIYGLSLLSILCFFVGSINSYVLAFRGSPVLAADLTAAGTALSVANQYEFRLTRGIFLSALLLYLVLALLSAFSNAGMTQSARMLTFTTPVVPLFHRQFRLHIPRLFTSLLAALILLLGITQVNFAASFSIPVNMYVPLITYRIAGFAPSLITFYQKMKVDPPEGYSEEAAADTLSPYLEQGQLMPSGTATPSSAKRRPTVIAIMNESFSDLRAVGPFACSDEHLSYLYSLQGDPNIVEYGHNYVSTYGGGTSTTEFEFLTGNSMAWLQGTNPYGAFQLTGVPSIVNLFRDAGYKTIALHPENPNNWRRSTVYPALGFDEFLSVDDFAGYEKTVRNRISDRGDYQKLIDVYEEYKEADAPLFLFNVTMQNHGEYDLSRIPKEKQVSLSDNYNRYDDVRAYESLLHQSDDALRYLLDYFGKEENPVLICFFGDHQPNLNDEFEEQLSESGAADNEDSLTAEERRRIVPYFIWSNYGVSPADVKTNPNGTAIMSTNYLGAQLRRYAGLPLSAYESFLLAGRESVPVINSLGYYGNDAKFHALPGNEENPETKESEETGRAIETQSQDARSKTFLSQYAIIEYNALFDKHRDNRFFSVSGND